MSLAFAAAVPTYSAQPYTPVFGAASAVVETDYKPFQRQQEEVREVCEQIMADIQRRECNEQSFQVPAAKIKKCTTTVSTMRAIEKEAEIERQDQKHIQRNELAWFAALLVGMVVAAAGSLCVK